MKSNLIAKLVLASSLAVSLACSEGLFVGAQGDYNFKSKQKLTATDTLGSLSETMSSGQFGLGIKGGYDFNNYKIYTQYVYSPETDDSKTIAGEKFTLKWSSHDLVVGGDYTPKVTKNIKALVGGFIGVSMANFKYEDFYTSADRINIDVSLPAFIFGIKLGGIYDINKNSAVDFGLKFSQANYQQYKMEDYTGGVRDYEKFELKRTNTGLFVGYNYKF